MLRSIGAIVAGYIATVILTMITIPLLGVIFPASLNPANTGWVIANIAYGAVFAGIGGYVAALVAQKSEIKHATILAVIMLVLRACPLLHPCPILKKQDNLSGIILC